MENLVTGKEMIRQDLSAISKVMINPLDIVQRLGKYQFVFDYQIPSFWTTLLSQNIIFGGSLINNSPMVKEGGSNANMIAPSGQSFPQPVKFNSESQVGTFSKGNIVNVIRFEGNNAIIENPNFVEPDLNAPKVGFFGNLGEKFKKEFSIPKDYLQKVDDNLAVTVSTGILYGANMKPQPVYDMPPVEVKPYVKPKPYLVVQEFNIKSYYTDWRTKETLFHELPVIKGSVLFYPIEAPQDQQVQYDLAFKQGKLKELPIVSVVSLVDKQVGKCISDGALYKTMEYNPCRTVKKGETLIGYIANGVFTNTNQDVIKPQLSFGEYKLVQTNSGTVIPTKNNNKNMLMIAGAFFIGYALFSNGKKE